MGHKGKMDPLRVIVTGIIEEYDHYEYIAKELDTITERARNVLLLTCGYLSGVEPIARVWAGERGHRVRNYGIAPYIAKFGEDAARARNLEICRNADLLLTFWDRIHRPTGLLIQRAKRYNLPLWIYEV